MPIIRIIEFITTFYTEVESVSPKADAIPFTLYDRTGKPYSMNDFLGTYVLLDFCRLVQTLFRRISK